MEKTMEENEAKVWDWNDIYEVPTSKRLEILFTQRIIPSIRQLSLKFQLPAKLIQTICREKTYILRDWKYNPEPDVLRLTKLDLDNLIAVTELIMEWKRRVLLQGLQMTNEALKLKANHLLKTFNASNFEISRNWIMKFEQLYQSKKFRHFPNESSLEFDHILNDIKFLFSPETYARLSNDLKHIEYLHSQRADSDTFDNNDTDVTSQLKQEEEEFMRDIKSEAYDEAYDANSKDNNDSADDRNLNEANDESNETEQQQQPEIDTAENEASPEECKGDHDIGDSNVETDNVEKKIESPSEDDHIIPDEIETQNQIDIKEDEIKPKTEKIITEPETPQNLATSDDSTSHGQEQTADNNNAENDLYYNYEVVLDNTTVQETLRTELDAIEVSDYALEKNNPTDAEESNAQPITDHSITENSDSAATMPVPAITKPRRKPRTRNPVVSLRTGKVRIQYPPVRHYPNFSMEDNIDDEEADEDKKAISKQKRKKKIKLDIKQSCSRQLQQRQQTVEEHKNMYQHGVADHYIVEQELIDCPDRFVYDDSDTEVVEEIDQYHYDQMQKQSSEEELLTKQIIVVRTLSKAVAREDNYQHDIDENYTVEYFDNVQDETQTCISDCNGEEVDIDIGCAAVENVLELQMSNSIESPHEVGVEVENLPSNFQLQPKIIHNSNNNNINNNNNNNNNISNDNIYVGYETVNGNDAESMSPILMFSENPEGDEFEIVESILSDNDFHEDTGLQEDNFDSNGAEGIQNPPEEYEIHEIESNMEESQDSCEENMELGEDSIEEFDVAEVNKNHCYIELVETEGNVLEYGSFNVYEQKDETEIDNENNSDNIVHTIFRTSAQPSKKKSSKTEVQAKKQQSKQKGTVDRVRKKIANQVPDINNDSAVKKIRRRPRTNCPVQLRTDKIRLSLGPVKIAKITSPEKN